METFEITESAAILIRLINDQMVKSYNLPISQINTGAAPLTPKVIQKLAKQFPHVAIRQGWGMTESCSCITSTPPELQTWDYAGTVGTVVANTTIKVVDPESGKELGFGAPGEVRLTKNLLLSRIRSY